MKLSNTLRILCLLFSFFTLHSSFSQNVPSYVPTNGLVGWWPFNGNANDESGNGNHGTAIGSVLTNDRMGNTNKAFFFNGTDNYITVPYNPNLAITGDISIMAWVKTNGPNSLNYQTVVSKRNTYWTCEYSMGYSYHNGIAHNGKFGFARTTGMGIGQQAFSKNNYLINEWENWIIVCSNGMANIYKNGNLDTSLSFTLVPNASNSPLLFGKNTLSDNSEQFHGSIDDIGLWNRALTQQEITNLYNASLPPSCPSLPTNLQTGLVGYWPFCGNANDESGNGNHGTVNGAKFSMDRFMNSNSSFYIDGVDCPNAKGISLPSTLNNATEYSISMWFKSADLTKSNQSYFNSSPHQYVGAGYNYIGRGAVSSLGIGNGTWVNAGSTGNIIWNTPNGGAWNNLIIVKTTQSFTAYENGNQVYQYTISPSFNSGTINQIVIGASSINGGINCYEVFKGWVDDVAIYNRALSPAEVTQLYQSQNSNLGDGNVGINVATPQRSLHVKDIIRLEPRNTAPDNPVRGDIYYDGLLNKLRVYDGTSWQNCW